MPKHCELPRVQIFILHPRRRQTTIQQETNPSHPPAQRLSDSGRDENEDPKAAEALHFLVLSIPFLRTSCERATWEWSRRPSLPTVIPLRNFILVGDIKDECCGRDAGAALQCGGCDSNYHANLKILFQAPPPLSPASPGPRGVSDKCRY
jgi:hypothetical protein